MGQVKMSKTERREDIQAYFDRKSVRFDAFYGQETEKSEVGLFNRIFRKAIYRRMQRTYELLQDLGESSTVLDVGCGSGRVSTLLARAGAHHVTGIDLSQEMLNLARRRAEKEGCSDRCDFILGDFMTWKSREEFTMVIALGVFDYLQSPEPLLRKMASFATKRAVASFPGYSWWRTPQRKIRYMLRGCPVYFYRKSFVWSLMSSIGADDVEVEDIGDSCYLGIAYL